MQMKKAQNSTGHMQQKKASENRPKTNKDTQPKKSIPQKGTLYTSTEEIYGGFGG
jgi:hypothetical protein